MIITPASSGSFPQTQDTPDAPSLAALHEDALEYQASIVSTMEDCGSFISVWAAMGLSMSRGSVTSSYSIVAERIITDNWDLVSHPATQRLLPIAAFEILYSAYKNDPARQDRQLPFLPADLALDMIRTAMFISSANGCVDAGLILFSAGVNADSSDKKGQTCLHTAAIHNKIEMVSFLISRDANVNHKRKDGQTVRTLVWCSQEHEIISHLLIQAGADKHVLDNDANPIYSSAAGGNVDVVRLLLRQGVNPSIQTTYQWQSLYWAASNGHSDYTRQTPRRQIAARASNRRSDEHGP